MGPTIMEVRQSKLAGQPTRIIFIPNTTFQTYADSSGLILIAVLYARKRNFSREKERNYGWWGMDYFRPYLKLSCQSRVRAQPDPGDDPFVRNRTADRVFSSEVSLQQGQTWQIGV